MLRALCLLSSSNVNAKTHKCAEEIYHYPIRDIILHGLNFIYIAGN